MFKKWGFCGIYFSSSTNLAGSLGIFGFVEQTGQL